MAATVIAAATNEQSLKTNFCLPLLVSTALLALPANAWALPPRQHHLHGMVQSVDVPARTFTVRKSAQAQPLLIRWDERTKFLAGKEPAKAEDLHPGQPVCLRYRALPGRLEAARVMVRRENTDRTKGSAKGGAGDLMSD